MQFKILFILLISVCSFAQTPSPTPIKIPNPLSPCLMSSVGKPSLAAYQAAHCN